MKQLSFFDKGFGAKIYKVQYTINIYVLFTLNDETMLYYNIGKHPTPNQQALALSKAQKIVDKWNSSVTAPDFMADVRLIAPKHVGTFPYIIDKAIALFE